MQTSVKFVQTSTENDTGLDIEDLKSPMYDRRTVPIEKKYELAMKGSYLINAVNRISVGEQIGSRSRSNSARRILKIGSDLDALSRAGLS